MNSMHITLIIHSLVGGGAERVTSHMASYWADKGHRVSVVTIASAENNRYTLPAPIELHALGIDGKSTGLLSGLASNISRILTIRKTIKKLNPDIVISMMAPSNVMAGLACINLPAKCIGSERNYPGLDYIGGMWIFLRKHCYRFVDTVVTQTKIGEQWILDNTSAKRVITIPNPLLLPLPDFEPKVLPNKQHDRKLILGVGRLTNQKQFDHLIGAFAKIAHQHDRWDLAIVGEGENREQLNELIIDQGLSERVHLVGRAGNISDWYEAADIFAMTSITEGFPNALIEAMAHGVPSISYDCLTGPAEVIDNNVNGILVEPNNINAFSEALERVVASEVLQKKLSENACEIVTVLAPAPVMSKWENEIERLIRQRN